MTPHLETENAELRGQLERAEADLAKTRKVIEVQGNVWRCERAAGAGSAKTDPKAGR